MSDQLLSYFERELAYVRKALDNFSGDYPAHADALRLNQSGQEDPNISRLIDAVALLTAKSEKRLDEQLPDILQDLLNLLYPGYLQIVPSYAPVTLAVGDDPISERVILPKGAELGMSVAEEECIFTLADDLVIEPYELTDVKAETAPFTFPLPAQIRRAESAIHLQLSCSDPEQKFAQQSKGEHLDLYVRGFENNSKGLIDLLLRNTEALLLHNDQGQQCVLSGSHLRSRVADQAFQWLPSYGSHTLGLDILRDYFAYPDKAAYLRLEGVAEALADFDSHQVTLTLFVKQLPTEYLRLFDKDVFQLNTAPAINLFHERGEPMRYDFAKLSMPVVADAQNQAEKTVVSVESVSEVSPTGEIRLSPNYEGGYWHDGSAPVWQARQYWDERGKRRMNLSLSYGEHTAQQTSVLLSLQLAVCNGRLPCLTPRFSPLESFEAIDLPGQLQNVRTPSAPQYPPLDNQLGWRFIALLNGNFASLTQTDDTVRSLQEALRLCSYSNQCALADAIKKVSYRHLVAPLTIDKQSFFASGTQVTILLDDELLGVEFAVASTVLNAFLLQYCSFDRFIQVHVERFGSDVPGIQFAKFHGSQLCL